MNVAWSLSYEWFFYLLLPIGVALTGFRKVLPDLGSLPYQLLRSEFFAFHLAWPEMCYVPGNPSRTCRIRAIMFLGGAIVIKHRKELRRAHKRTKVDKACLACVCCRHADCARYGWLPKDGQRGHLSSKRGAHKRHGFSIILPLGLFRNRRCPDVIAATSLESAKVAGKYELLFYLLHGVPLHAFGALTRRVLPAPTEMICLLISLLSLPLVLGATTVVCAVLSVCVEEPASLSAPPFIEKHHFPPRAGVSRDRVKRAIRRMIEV